MNFFSRFAKSVAHLAGQPRTFVFAVMVTVVWLLSGPVFHFSDSWQLVINTATTIITFLMVFLIQNTQNRESNALRIKIDELLRATKEAHNALLDLEKLDDKTLDEFLARYESLAEKAREELNRGESDKGTPET